MTSRATGAQKKSGRFSESAAPATIAAGEFKTHCLRLMDEVAEQHSELVITKHGKPVAKLVPLDDETPDSWGALCGSVTYRDNIVAPDHESWDEATP
jgi:prevent-host-death family protein